MAIIHDVAAYLIDQLRPSVTDPMKLHKLAYFSQGWTLALLDRPLFEDDFEAWTYGPVAPVLYAEHRQRRYLPSWPLGDPNRLDAQETFIVGNVVRQYGALGGWQLSQLTHMAGSPWSEVRAREGVAPDMPSQVTIGKDSIKEYFKQLLA
ncbi:MAG: DUF4065 domain-containing protein [Propionibacteriaceae bacterium]|nr:DUF4065 domain-containing protein [Propionibacteriaceae bacterium]